MKSLKRICLQTWARIKTFLHRERIGICCAINALFILLGSYEANNIMVPFDTEIGAFKSFENNTQLVSKVLSSISDGKWYLRNYSTVPDSSLSLINVGFSKEPVTVYADEDELFVRGEEYITNRKQLYDFLKIACDDNSYRYIMLDVELDNTPHPYNDSLIDVLAKMERISIAACTNLSRPLISEALQDKVGNVNYVKTQYETSFVKSVLLMDGQPSLSLKAYEACTGHSMRKVMWGIYSDNGVPCVNSPYIHYRLRIGQDMTTLDNATAHNDFQGLIHLQECLDEPDVAKYVRDKVIVVGDFTSPYDQHTTYVGMMSGPLINANIFLDLCAGSHTKKHGVFYIILFLLYGLITWQLITETHLRDRLLAFRWVQQHSAVGFVISVLKYTAIFYITCWVLYVFTDVFYNPWFPILWFSWLELLLPIVKNVKWLRK